jgi:hypothetical protein
MKKVPVWFDNKIVAHALVDDVDYELVMQYKWWADRKYACTSYMGKYTHMHVVILGKAPTGFMWDHANGRGLDNQRSNLRLATRVQNSANTSGLGVYEYTDKPRNKRWGAILHVGGKKYRKMCYTEEEAKIARDEMVRMYQPEFGRYHFPRKGERGMDGQLRKR